MVSPGRIFIRKYSQGRMSEVHSSLRTIQLSQSGRAMTGIRHADMLCIEGVQCLQKDFLILDGSFSHMVLLHQGVSVGLHGFQPCIA